jgi:two-component system sensor histidine kinase/response regulator
VESALQNLTVAIQEAQANIKCGSLPAVLGDRGQLMQLFQNLIANALKFRKAGEAAAVTISAVSAQRNGHSHIEHGQRFAQFSITDNGIGIAPEHFERIFLIFQRLHTRTQYPGTGIGLSICKKVVERHGGRIWVESTAGKGTTFRFTLPAP